MNAPCAEPDCGHRHCAACARPDRDPPVLGRHLEAYEVATCFTCVADTRQTLVRLRDAVALLGEQMVDGNRGVRYDGRTSGSPEPPMPGGDALVLAGPGSVDAEDDEALDSDPESVAAVLVQCADAMHDALGGPFPPALDVLDWMDQHLDRYAKAGGEGVRWVKWRLGRLLAAVENATGAGVRTARADANCLDCGAPLSWPQYDPAPCSCRRPPRFPTVPHFPRRARDAEGKERELTDAEWTAVVNEWTKHRDAAIEAHRQAVKRWHDRHDADDDRHYDGCDQGGQRPYVKCSNPTCRREYDRESYRLAIKAMHDDIAHADDERLADTGALERGMGVPANRVRQWKHLGWLNPVRWSGVHRGYLYRLGDVRDLQRRLAEAS